MTGVYLRTLHFSNILLSVSSFVNIKERVKRNKTLLFKKSSKLLTTVIYLISPYIFTVFLSVVSGFSSSQYTRELLDPPSPQKELKSSSSYYFYSCLQPTKYLNKTLLIKLQSFINHLKCRDPCDI